MEYYVYVYLDPRKPGNYVYENHTFDYEPIYIGKGKGRRYKQHPTQCVSQPNKSFFYKKLNKIISLNYVPIYYIIENGLYEYVACKKEIELISLIGRLDENNGTLCNLTNGGEGTSGYKMSDETKEKIRNVHLGHTRWKENGHPMKDKSFDEYFGEDKSNELKIKISDNAKPYWKDKELTEEMKYKISETLKERFENKENHPMYGKTFSQESKDKKSKSMKMYWENNPATEEYKKIISEKTTGENNPCFIIYTLTNKETNEIVELKGRDSVIEYIMKHKKENNILPRRSPSHVKLLSSGESFPFTLTKHKPNKKVK